MGTRLRVEALREKIAALEERRRAHIARCGHCSCDDDSMLEAEIRQVREALANEERHLLHDSRER
jgi:hypothetical protein